MSYSDGHEVSASTAAPPGSLTHSVGRCILSRREARTTPWALRRSACASIRRGSHFVGWYNQSRPLSTPESAGAARSPWPRRGRPPLISLCNGSAAGSTNSTRNLGRVRNSPATRYWLRRQTSSHGSRERRTMSAGCGTFPVMGEFPPTWGLRAFAQLVAQRWWWLVRMPLHRCRHPRSRTAHSSGLPPRRGQTAPARGAWQ